MTEFNDIIDTDGLDPDEEARLRRAHALLVQAGPPPDLPPALEAPPTQPNEAEIIQFPCCRSVAGRSRPSPRRRLPS